MAVSHRHRTVDGAGRRGRILVGKPDPPGRAARRQRGAVSGFAGRPRRPRRRGGGGLRRTAQRLVSRPAPPGRLRRGGAARAGRGPRRRRVHPARSDGQLGGRRAARPGRFAPVRSANRTRRLRRSRRTADPARPEPRRGADSFPGPTGRRGRPARRFGRGAGGIPAGRKSGATRLPRLHPAAGI